MTKPKKITKRKLKVKRLLILILGVISVTLLVCFLLNRSSVVIQPNGEEITYVEYGTTYKEEGATAKMDQSIFKFLAEPLQYSTSGSVDSTKLGTYEVTYTTTHEGVTKTTTRKVIIEDTLPPELTLVSSPDSYTPFNNPYTEEGYSAIDNFDGDITDQVVREEKDGKVYYSISDSHGNTSEAVRTITYDDRKGPDITFATGNEVVTYLGEDYQDSYSAIDDVDGDVTSSVSVTGSVDTNTIGDYTLTYTVSDSHQNESTATKLVHVMERPVNTATNENNKTIYLTFDDGPGQFTDRLLDILDQYNVKATFFTTSAFSNYAYCIGEEAARGHTVAVHTFTHDYATIYSSTDAYWEDFNDQNNVIIAQTGKGANIFRFPGGSSNTISANYTSGIMSALANQSAARGLTYFDWNVSSGDAGETTSTETVYQNVISQVSANSNYGVPSVVLQHDVKGFSVDAVARIIEWGLSNGYNFAPLSAGSHQVHHPIYN